VDIHILYVGKVSKGSMSRKLLALALVGFFVCAAVLPGAQARPGDLDTTFGRRSRVGTEIGILALAFTMFLQPDNKIIAAGTALTGTSQDFALVRYNADGSLD
jgi:hypothetical protein